MCDSKQKAHMNMGPILNGCRDMVKRRYDHPASTNSNYVINNITTNITCMQVLTIVLLMICNGQNPGSSTSGTSHTKFSKMPPPTSMHLWTRCRVLRVARRSVCMYVHSMYHSVICHDEHGNNHRGSLRLPKRSFMFLENWECLKLRNLKLQRVFLGRWVSPFHRPRRPLGRVEV